MNLKRFIATLELFLIFPATLFIVALFLRNVQPAPYEPGADRTPSGGLVCCPPAFHAHLSTLLIVAATFIAGGILGIVALHMITD